MTFILTSSLTHTCWCSHQFTNWCWLSQKIDLSEQRGRTASIQPATYCGHAFSVRVIILGVHNKRVVSGRGTGRTLW